MWVDELLTGLQVERSINALDDQEVALKLDHLVYLPASGEAVCYSCTISAVCIGDYHTTILQHTPAVSWSRSVVGQLRSSVASRWASSPA